MSDALLSSPQIPLGVNIVRLAGTSDEEGITALARSITVRYIGSTLSLQQTQPMSILSANDLRGGLSPRSPTSLKPATTM